jgi:predicted negative regulator of RcsB-dependent stress response
MALYRFNSSDKAQKLEYDAYKAYYSLYQKDAGSGQDRAGKALELFRQAYSLKKSPRLLLFIADAEAELNKLDDALKTLDDFTKRYSREEALMPLAYQKIAAVQLRKGSKEEARKALDKIAGAQGDLLKDYALVSIGRMLEQEGKKDEAIAKYRELSEKFPDSPYAEEVKSKLGAKKEG